jgi:hypothetical protein
MRYHSLAIFAGLIVFGAGITVGQWLLPRRPNAHLPPVTETDIVKQAPALTSLRLNQTVPTAPAPAQPLVLSVNRILAFRQVEGQPSWESGIRDRLSQFRITLNNDGTLVMHEPSGAPIFPARGTHSRSGEVLQIVVNKDARQGIGQYSVDIRGQLALDRTPPIAELHFNMGHTSTRLTRNSVYEAVVALRR